MPWRPWAQGTRRGLSPPGIPSSATLTSRSWSTRPSTRPAPTRSRSTSATGPPRAASPRERPRHRAQPGGQRGVPPGGQRDQEVLPPWHGRPLGGPPSTPSRGQVIDYVSAADREKEAETRRNEAHLALKHIHCKINFKKVEITDIAYPLLSCSSSAFSSTNFVLTQ